MKHFQFDYDLVRSKRRTLAICITKDGTIQVRAPKKASTAFIEGFLLEKQDWIERKMAQMKDQTASMTSFSLNFGSMLSLMGKQYPLMGMAENKCGFDGKVFYAPQTATPEILKEMMVKIYKHLAKEILQSKTTHYAQTLGVAPAAIKINSAKTRWGSCSGKNSINFSWLLVMAPPEAIDYVVVHELCHIKEHNHSPAFWQEVENVLADYKQRQQLLKILQKKLAQEDWA